ncbi:hypothetical protein CDD80_2507 [Ophiocordyceps camponoti-rufipedis]|uniref:Uncharacterized protein n=1 Tax=Ophiocordyceps camponoti-rufipedis TaxID=2004952 RepID=A0A2C5Z7W2_9HYPO|nr:hypothetical protein CDD80_2507 [Ophiocordyceps camponoti-rufipedis]
MDTSEAEPRPFQPVLVGACYAQTAKDRFGSQAATRIRERERVSEGDFNLAQGETQDLPESESEADGNNNAETSQESFIPFMQRFRNNLTVLSQLYNLYMVAYQGQIFVYVPRSVPSQRIPSQPDLRLIVPATNVSSHIRGCIDRNRPHLINHIIVGSLGNEEIIVTSFDDGDVAVYTTREIADCILSRQPDVPILIREALPGPKRKKPKPFFHENVGRTAWGLAIHQKSRLIAVTSNRCEVTVFAPALWPAFVKEEDKAATHREPDWCDACQPRTCIKAENHVRQRARSWRIVVTLGIGVGNMPSVCFIDDGLGFASLVCAVDIKGNLWLADIWKPHVPATMLPCRFDAQVARVGWGILALRRSTFVAVETIGELLGTNKDCEPLSFHRLDIAQSLREIPENPYDYSEDASGSPSAADATDADLAPVDGDPGGEGGSDHGDTTDDDATETDDGSDAGGNMVIAMLMDGAPAEVEGAGVMEAPPAQLQGPPAQLQPPPAQLQMPPAQLQPPPAQLQVPPAQLQGGPPAQLQQLVAPVPSATLMTSSTWAPKWKAPERTTLAEQAEEARKRRSELKRPMAYFPHTGTMVTMPQKKLHLLAFLLDDGRAPNETGDVPERLQLMEDYYLLSFWQEDVELSRFRLWPDPESNRETGVVCVRALKRSVPQQRGLMRQLFEATDRISMIAHVPELSLVVAASASGRVLLLTPTTLRDPEMREAYPLRAGFRIEWVLPRRSDESRWRRQPRPLYGMAVGPVQGEVGPVKVGSGTEERTASRRLFRLMLHYRNHDVLTYEITRVQETGEMCIF